MVLRLQACNAFLKFLEESLAFYKAVASKLQLVFGSVGFDVGAEDAGALNGLAIPTDSQNQDCRSSVWRCIVCLGDLARSVSIYACAHVHSSVM